MRSGCRPSIEPLTGGEAVVAAPAAGRFMSAQPACRRRLACRRVRSSGASSRGSARAAPTARRWRRRSPKRRRRVDAARAELARAERLLAERAVPAGASRTRSAPSRSPRRASTAAQARLAQRDETLRTGGGAAGGNSFVLRAPIAGVVAEVFAALGASYDEGAPLFRIVRTDRVELQAHVPASDAPLGARRRRDRARDSRAAGSARRRADHMHDAGVIDPKTRALPVQFDVDNRGGQLLIGQTATAILYTGSARADAGRAEGRRADGGRPAVRLRADRRRKLRAPLHRDRRARRRSSSASAAASSPASAS